MILFEKKYCGYAFGGILAGLFVGGFFTLLTGESYWTILYLIVGILIGIVLAQGEKIKDIQNKKLEIKE